MLRDRAAHHLAAGLVHAQPILNQGRASGASIEHPHAQLIALGFIPPHVEMLLSRFAVSGTDLVADAIEIARAGAFVVNDDSAIIWCPPASPTPFVMRVALPYGRQRFDLATDDEIAVLTRALQDALARLRRAARRGRIQRGRAHRTARRSATVPLVGRHRSARLGVWRLRDRNRALGQHPPTRSRGRDAARRDFMTTAP